MKTNFDIYNALLSNEITIDDLKSIAASFNIYPDSINEKDGSLLFLVKVDNVKSLVILKQGPLLEKFEGDIILSGEGKICPLNRVNSRALRDIFPYTAPVSHRGRAITIGLGDRLGLASPGHLRLTKRYNFFPVLAQQSIRELNLTGRTYYDVLDAASWAVFQEGYRGGFGADGDHLKTDEEIKMALDCGFTMITLDCSEHIDNSVYEMSDDEIREKYLTLPKALREGMEKKYLNRIFPIGRNFDIRFNEMELMKIVLVYLDTIEYTTHVYNTFISSSNRAIDFEMSIDETLFTTSIEAHYFVASELADRGVKVDSLAPRFCGEFQKGIDYIGSSEEFEKEFNSHYLISKHFGYKLSVHSGSDKFSIFPIVGRTTKGYYHLKTAGTNWLEAVRVIAIKDPSLFREMYNFGARHLGEAKKYYHIKADFNDIISLDDMADKDLPHLMDDENARQILHITYGLILQARGEDEAYLFKDKIFTLLNTCEEEYYEALYNHIGNHLEKLDVEKI